MDSFLAINKTPVYAQLEAANVQRRNDRDHLTQYNMRAKRNRHNYSQDVDLSTNVSRPVGATSNHYTSNRLPEISGEMVVNLKGSGSCDSNDLGTIPGASFRELNSTSLGTNSQLAAIS